MHRLLILALLPALLSHPVRAEVTSSLVREELASSAVDETALRYYAATGQAARRDAEARRLQWLHPGWRVPDDLDREEVGRADEAPLWALFGADRLDELSDAIAARRASEPGWVPSAALRSKLDRKKRRIAVFSAMAGLRWRAAVEAAGTAADLDVDVLWAVAEAQAKVGREPEAAASFRTALARAGSSHERSVTIRKALAALPFPMVEPLLSLDRPDATGRPEFAGLADDVTRARLVAALAGSEKSAPPTDADLAAFAAKARASADAGEAALLGWWALRREARQEAAEWFSLSLDAKPDAAVAHGLAMTLDELGRDRDAEDLAFGWRERDASNALLYVTLASRAVLASDRRPVEPDRVARLARAAKQLESGDAAQALAWTAMRSCQFTSAAEWFRLALAWQPRESTARGAALSLLRLGRGAEAAAIVNRYDGLFPSVVALAFDTGERSPETCGPAPSTPVLRKVATPAGAFQVILPFPAPAEMANAAVEPRQAAGMTSGKVPLVARRVAGAGAMPYEAYGFALLTGWNGLDAPTLPAYADKRAARGTLDGDQSPLPKSPSATSALTLPAAAQHLALSGPAPATKGARP